MIDRNQLAFFLIHSQQSDHIAGLNIYFMIGYRWDVAELFVHRSHELISPDYFDTAEDFMNTNTYRCCANIECINFKNNVDFSKN